MGRPHRVIDVRNATQNLRGFLVIDEEIGGGSSAGLRMLPDVTEQELIDVAHALTYKHVFVGMPRGGARAGIIAPVGLSAEGKQKLVNAFGDEIKELIRGGKCIIAPDMGTTPEMILAMHRHIGIPRAKFSPVSKNAHHYTAHTVVESVKLLAHTTGKKLHEMPAAIEGLGKVGSDVAKMLNESGVHIQAVSNVFGAVYDKNGLPIEKILKLRGEHGDEWIHDFDEAQKIEKGELLYLPVDLLILSGRDHQIDSKNVHRVKARVVVAASNSAVSIKADRALFKRGILYTPDFVTGCGGVFGNAMEFLGLGEKEIKKLLNHIIQLKLGYIFKIAKKKSISMYSVSISICDTLLARAKSRVGRKTAKSIIQRRVLKAYRKGFLPQGIFRPFAGTYFRTLIESNLDIYEAHLDS